jgi:hypothetical protein
VSQGRMKCFIEYWEEHTVVLVTYRSPDQAPLPQEQEVAIPYICSRICTFNAFLTCTTPGTSVPCGRADECCQLCWEGSPGELSTVHLVINVSNNVCYSLYFCIPCTRVVSTSKVDRLLRLLSMESTAFASGMGQYCITACSLPSLFD